MKQGTETGEEAEEEAESKKGIREVGSDLSKAPNNKFPLSPECP